MNESAPQTTSSLYLLAFPERGLLKIGKANDVHIRGKVLCRCGGDIDYAASFELVAPINTVFWLEKSLQFLLSEHAVHFETGDGKTELFSLSAIELALKHLDFLMSSGLAMGTLKKGLATNSEAPTSLPAKPKIPKKKFTKEDASREVVKKFQYINRLLALALANKARWAYQYQITGSEVSVKIKGRCPGFMDSNSAFAFKHPSGGASLCRSAEYEEEVSVFQFCPPFSPGDGGKWGGQINEHYRESLSLLRLLPELSPAGALHWQECEEFDGPGV